MPNDGSPMGVNGRKIGFVRQFRFFAGVRLGVGTKYIPFLWAVCNVSFHFLEIGSARLCIWAGLIFARIYVLPIERADRRRQGDSMLLCMVTGWSK